VSLQSSSDGQLFSLAAVPLVWYVGRDRFDVQESGYEGRVINLGGQIQDERLESLPFLRSAQVLEGMWQLDGMLEESTLGLGC
jgi:hypothetical protein